MVAISRTCSVLCLCQFTASGAYKNIFGMSPVLGNQVAWEKIEFVTASRAFMDLDPQEIFYVRILSVTTVTTCTVKPPDLFF